MNIKSKLTDHDIIILLTLAARVCSEPTTINTTNQLTIKQFNTIKQEAFKTLIRLDQQGAIIPPPTNGKPWAKHKLT